MTDTIYNSNYVLLLLVQHILHYSLGTSLTYIRLAMVGLDSSRGTILILGLRFLFFVARFQKAVSTLIKRRRVEVKLIEICTEHCCNQRLLPSEDWLDLWSFCGVPPPSGSLPPGLGCYSRLCEVTARGGTACMTVLPAWKQPLPLRTRLTALVSE